MDSNTNTPIDPDAPLPLGPPLHPEDDAAPEPQADPATSPPPPQIIEPSLPPQAFSPPPQQMLEPSLPPQAFVPDLAASPQPPQAASAPGSLLTSSNIIMPTQNPLGSPSPPMSPALGATPAFDPQTAFNPQVAGPPPAAPVVVSGGFAPNTPMAPAFGAQGPAFQTAGAPLSPASPPPSGKGHRLKRLLVVLAGIVVLAGGSAAAYYGAVVPNQPANVLKTAIINSVKQNSVSFSSTAALSDKTGSSPSHQVFKISLDGSKNGTAKAADVTLGYNEDSLNLSLEARVVNQSLYLKPGSLSSVTALIDKDSPADAAYAKTIAAALSNKWIEVNNSLLSYAGFACFANVGLSVSQADINLLSADYSKHQFVNIVRTVNTSLDGQPVEAFVLKINGNTATQFISGLSGLSAVQSLRSCKEGAAFANAITNAKPTNNKSITAVNTTIWVNKADKRIERIAVAETSKDSDFSPNPAKASFTESFVAQLNYNNVTLPVPTNTESALQLYTKLQPTLNSLGIKSTSSLSGLSDGIL